MSLHEALLPNQPDVLHFISFTPFKRGFKYMYYLLAAIYVRQTIPLVQFGYDLRTPSHTLGNVWLSIVWLLHR